MTLECNNIINIQPTEESGGDTPAVEDIGTMYQCVSTDGTTFGTYSEMASNAVAELAMLKPFSSDYTGLSGLVTGNKKLTTTLTFKYVKDTTGLNGNLLYMTMTDNGLAYPQGIKITNKQLALPTAGTKNIELVVGNTYTVKLVFNNSTKSYSLYYKIVGQDTDFTLLEEVTWSMSTSSNNNYLVIMNTCSNNKSTAEYFHCADFDLTDITIDIDGEVIFSRAKNDGGDSGSIGIPRELNNGVLQMPSGSFSLPTGTTDLGNFALYYAFAYASGITSVDLSKLTTISGQYALSSAFYHAGVQSVDISNLVSITGDYGMNSTFNTNPNLQTVEFPKLVSIGKRAFANTFYGCSGLTNISFPELTTITGEWAFNGTFTNCAKLTTVTFPKLTTLSNNAMYECFSGCTGITDVYFPALTTSSFPSGVGYGNTPLKIFNNASGMRGKIHLPSNLSSITWIQNSTGSSASRQQYFGSDYCTVLLDLPATS